MHTEYVSDNDVFTPNARKKVLGNSGVEVEEADSCILEGEVTIKGVSVFRNCIPSQLTQGTTESWNRTSSHSYGKRKFLFALASSLFSHRGLVRTELSPHGNAKSLGLDLGARTDDFIREQFAKLSFAVDGRTRSKRARLIWENDLSEPNYC